MKVRITKASDEQDWHKEYIGEVFNVLINTVDNYCIEIDDYSAWVRKSDCEIIDTFTKKDLKIGASKEHVFDAFLEDEK